MNKKLNFKTVVIVVVTSIGYISCNPKLEETTMTIAKSHVLNYKTALEKFGNPERVCGYPNKLWFFSCPKDEFTHYFEIDTISLKKLAPPPVNYTGMRVYLSIDDANEEKYILAYTIKKDTILLYDSVDDYWIMTANIDWCKVIDHHNHHKSLQKNLTVPPIFTCHLCDPDCPCVGPGALLKDFR